MNLPEFEESLVFPWDDGEAGTTLVVGGILTLLSPLVVPGILVMGYGVLVIETVLDAGSTPPTFDDWGTIGVAGLKAVGILLAYLVVHLAIGVVLIAAILGAGGFRFPGVVLSPWRLPDIAGLSVVVGLLLAALVLGLGYLTPAAMVQLARSRRFRDAFAVSEVRSLAGSNAYASAWLLTLVVFVADGVALLVLNMIAVGVILGGFVSFYAVVSVAFLYGRGAHEAGVRTAGPHSTAGSTASNDPSGSTDSS